jgi:hypothetical protein
MGCIGADAGSLDVLPGCDPVGDFVRLERSAASMRLEDGEHRIIALDDLIAVKEHVARPKDIIVAVQLKAIRARMRHSEPSDDPGEGES